MNVLATRLNESEASIRDFDEHVDSLKDTLSEQCYRLFENDAFVRGFRELIVILGRGLAILPTDAKRLTVKGTDDQTSIDDGCTGLYLHKTGSLQRVSAYINDVETLVTEKVIVETKFSRRSSKTAVKH